MTVDLPLPEVPTMATRFFGADLHRQVLEQGIPGLKAKTHIFQSQLSRKPSGGLGVGILQHGGRRRQERFDAFPRGNRGNDEGKRGANRRDPVANPAQKGDKGNEQPCGNDVVNDQIGPRRRSRQVA